MTPAAAQPKLEQRNIVIDEMTCKDYSQSSHLEWLETNGFSSFASGTVSGANTRRYHGLLVASLPQRTKDDALAIATADERNCGFEFWGRLGRTVTRMIKHWRLCIVLMGVMGTSAFGQQSSPPSGESHKYRTTLTLAGGGGGFAIGLFAGLAVFDDATNSDRKVWTTAILAGIGGAVGGYFLGRALDRRNKGTSVTSKAAALEQRVVPTQWSGPWAPEISRSVQGLVLRQMGPSRSTTKSAGFSQAGTSAPSLDANYLYLVSALRTMQSGSRLDP